MEADLSQLEHLEHHESVVEEQVVTSDHSQVGEEVAEAGGLLSPWKHWLGQGYIGANYRSVSLGGPIY